jgi:Flp pilus assembly protein TadD
MMSSKDTSSQRQFWLPNQRLASGQVDVFDGGEGAELLERAFALAPRNADILSALGNYWLRENNFPKAREYYRRALQINPQNLSALNNLALLEMEDGHWAEAQTLLIAALRIEPNAPKIHELAARCAWELERQVHPSPSITPSVP